MYGYVTLVKPRARKLFLAPLLLLGPQCRPHQHSTIRPIHNKKERVNDKISTAIGDTSNAYVKTHNCLSSHYSPHSPVQTDHEKKERADDGNRVPIIDPDSPSTVHREADVDPLLARHGNISIQEFDTDTTAQWSIHRPTVSQKLSSYADVIDTPCVLIINNMSEALEQEDFFGLLPRGRHIQGWKAQGGLLRAIPGRDIDTFQRQNYWILLFSSPEFALVYRDTFLRTASLARRYMPKSINSPRVPLTGLLHEGEDIAPLLRDYKLHAPSQKPIIRNKVPPFSQTVSKLIRFSSHWSQLEHNGERLWPVRFCVMNCSPNVDLSIRRIIKMIKDDGKRRGAYWRISRSADDIYRLVIKSREVRERETDPLFGQQGLRRKPLDVWSIQFTLEAEARRFVRTWNNQPFPFLPEWGENTSCIEADCLF